MKITKVDVFEVHTRRPAWRPVLCRIYTDEGIYGDGEPLWPMVLPHRLPQA